MDTLGIKENSRSIGLSKNYKKEKHDWTPMELEIDDAMKINFIPANGEDPSHYTCSVPWKDKIPKLKNNLPQVLNRQVVYKVRGDWEKELFLADFMYLVIKNNRWGALLCYSGLFGKTSFWC